MEIIEGSVWVLNFRGGYFDVWSEINSSYMNDGDKIACTEGPCYCLI